MDKHEASTLLSDKLTKYRRFRYSDLVDKIGDNDCLEVAGPTGVKYQIEVQFMWDGNPDEDVRVMGAIDDGRLRRAFLPLCESFIVTPDGCFLGE